jgi:hypothetical protein
MNKRRLLKLADLLEADAKNRKGIKFDLEVIASKAVGRDGDYEEFEPGEVPEINCGTAACAVGLACISGAFKHSGLSYQITGWGLEPKFVALVGWSRAETTFFGLTEDESTFLFREDSYPIGKTRGAVGERYVANRIRDFVAGKVAP